MSDLTELGLKKPTAPSSLAPPSSSSQTSASHEPLAHRRSELCAHFLDRLLDVIGHGAPESDAGECERFRARLAEFREGLADPRRRAELPQIADACIALCRGYFEGARYYHAEREKELNEVIAILREAAQLSFGDASDFNAQVLASSDRFNRIAELENLRELRRRMGDEIGTLRQVVADKQQREEQAYAQLSTRVEALQKKLAEMEVEATVDPLTRVGNRRRFDMALERLVSAAREAGAPLTLAMIDIDHFKQINDTHGHPIGDRVLLCVAQWILKSIRQTDIVSRYGGEEFAVLLSNANASEVEPRFRQLLQDIAGSCYEYDVLGRKEKVRFTVSCGLVDLTPTESADDLVRRADDALYEAKRKGRNRVVSRKRSLIGRVLAWN